MTTGKDTKAAPKPATNATTNTTAADAAPKASTKKEEVSTGNDGTPIGGAEQDKDLAARLNTMDDRGVASKAGGQMDALKGR